MRMRDVLGPKGNEVFTVSGEATLLQAMREMVRRNVGSLMVVDGSAIRGIITERDLLRRAADDPLCLEVELVQEAMTTALLTAGLDDRLHAVMDVMTRNRVRHLPVLEDGALAGLVSIGDVVNACLEAAEFEKRQMQNYIQGMG